MPLNNSRQAIIEDRRRKVARMRLRGYTQREITQGLASAGERNPTTNEPWSLGIVNSDLKALTKQWRKEASGDTEEMRGTQLAEIREARRLAWRVEKLYYIYEGLRQEAELLGLKLEPERDWGGAGASFLAGVETGTQMQAEDMSSQASE